ncbi:MAG: AbrB/MazE/SpoVT family DNA-binding domain-containing protein [Candidatus Freyarchaeota archaeon]
MLPKSWRKRYAKEGKIYLQIKDDAIIIKPYRLADLREFFDKIEVDVNADLSNWKSVKRELFEVR